MRVVLVDDDKLIRDEIKSMIDWEQEGFTLAHEASNGKDALHWLEIHPAEIVITDIAMPVMDGIELIRSLKEHRFPGKILVMSNYQEFDYVKDAMKYGAFDYCLKYKLDPPGLLELLRGLVERIKDESSERSRALREERLRLIRDACLIAPGAEEIRRFEVIEAGRRFHILYARGQLSGFESGALACLRMGADWVALSADKGVVLMGEKFSGEAAVRQALAECAAGLRQVAPDVRVAYCLSTVPFSGIHRRLSELQEASRMFFYGGADVVLEDARPMVPLIPAEEVEKALENMLEAVRQVRRSAFAESLRNFLREAERLGADPRSVSGHLEAAAMRMIHYFQRIRVGDRSIERLKDLIRNMSDVDQRAADIEAAFLGALQPYFDAETIGRPVRMEITRAIQYMNSHLSGTLSLQEVASYVGLSRNHFCTIFRQETGMNFVDYLSSLRIEESKRLLKDPAYNVQQISYMVGIDNARYFCRLFKERTGMSPTQFRKGQP